MISLGELGNKLFSQKKVALFCHVRPDGDTIGSAIALQEVLLNRGIKTDVLCDDPIPSRFFILDGAKKIKTNLDNDYTALVAIDCADIDRLGSFASVFLNHPNTFCIDHHISNTRYAKFNYVNDSASNAENVYELIVENSVEITPSIANAILLGIMTDTGAFKHRNVTENTLLVASKLKQKGADLNKIYYHMFTLQSKERAKLFGITMSKIKYYYENKLAVATVRLSDLELSNAKQDETEGFIDFVMGIDGVEVGVCIMETAVNKFKISFRSKGVDVNEVASSFGGGGHVLASGCQIYGEYEEVLDKVTFAIKRALPDII